MYGNKEEVIFNAKKSFFIERFIKLSMQEITLWISDTFFSPGKATKLDKVALIKAEELLFLDDVRKGNHSEIKKVLTATSDFKSLYSVSFKLLAEIIQSEQDLLINNPQYKSSLKEVWDEAFGVNFLTDNPSQSETWQNINTLLGDDSTISSDYKES